MVLIGDRRARLARLGLPLHLCCDSCGRHHDKGTMLFSYKEDLTEGERYIGAVKIFRFYFSCIQCRARITFKTDPEHNDYTVEAGATREFD